MTPTFEDVMKFTDSVGPNLLLDDTEARAYYDVCCSLPDGASVLEIGLFYGRSTSIVLQVGQSKGFRYTGVDPFLETRSQLPDFMDMVERSGFSKDRFIHIEAMSDHADISGPFDMALIDGNHDTDYVTADCLKAMPLIVPGGYICLHDYGRDSLAGVKWGADATIGVAADWALTGVSGTLAVWKKQ